MLFSLSALALAGVAVAMILPALLGRRPLNRDDSARQNIRLARRRIEELEQSATAEDAETLAQSRTEIERALLDDLHDQPDERATQTKQPGKGWTALILILIPALSAALYLALGTPSALMPPAAVAESPPAKMPTVAEPPSEKMPTVAEMVRRLEQKLADNPGNADNWALAGRAYMTLGQFNNAERAYQTLHQLRGDHPDVLTAWADAAVMANAGKFSTQTQTNINRALTLAPNHPNALWLAALAAEARADYTQALAYLQRLLPLMENKPQQYAEVEGFIDRMQQLNAPSGEP